MIWSRMDRKSERNHRPVSKVASSVFAMLAVVLLLAAGARPALGQAACTGQTWTGTTPTVWAAEGSIKVMLNNTPTTNVPTIPTYLDDGNFNPAGYTGATTHPPITELNPVYSCPSGTPQISIAGAGRETVSFQVFITAGVGASAALSNVTVEVTPLSPVSGSGTTPLTSDNTQTSDVTRYLEGYIPYTSGSPATLQVSGSFGCMTNPNPPPAFISCVPDPLIPFYSQYDSGNPPVANTFNVQPGTTQGVWVDVSIPVISSSQPAGTYAGTVTVMEGGSTLATIPLTLAVWSGNLPRFDSPNRPDMLKAWMPLWASEFVGEENLSCPSGPGPSCSADQAMMWKYQIMAHAYDFDTYEDGYTPLNGSTASYPSTSPTSFTTSAPTGPGSIGTTSTINWTAWDAYYGPAFTLGGPSAGGLFADGTAIRVFDSPAGTGGNCPWTWSSYSWSCGTNTLPPTGLLQLYTNFSEQISQHFSYNQANKGWGQPELLAYTFDEPYWGGTPASLNNGDTEVFAQIAQFNQALNSANTALSPTMASNTNPVRNFLTDQVSCQTANDSQNGNYNSPQCQDQMNLSYPGIQPPSAGSADVNSWTMDWSPAAEVYMPGGAVSGSQSLDLVYYCGVTALTAGTNYAYTLDMNPANKGVPTQSTAPAPIEKWFYVNGGQEPFDVTDQISDSGVGQRANFWIAYKYGLDETVPSVGDPNPAPSPGGVWDWAAEIWNSGQPYTNSGSWFFYPGNQLSAYNASGAIGNSILPQSLIHNGGGGITGPVASIRMEQWRRGYEDYMYLYSYGHKGCTTAPAQCNRAAAEAVVDSMGGAHMTSGGSGTTSWNALVWQNEDPAFQSGVWPMSTPGMGGSLNVPATCTDSTSGAGGLSNGLPKGPTGADFYYGSGCPGEWTNNPDRYAAVRVALATDLGWTTQTITFPTIASQVYSGTPFTVQAPATASSGLPVTITVQSGSPATISGNTVTLTGTGTVTLTATQSGNADYSAAAPVTQSFTVTPASQTITFNPIASQVYAGTPFTVQAPATASSGLPVTITVQSGSPATISGNTVTITGAGTVTLTATQSGNADYNAATPVTQSFTVTAATPPTSSFTLTTNPATVIITPPATTGTTTLTLTPTGGYSGTVTLSCAGQPLYTSCVFTQSGATNNVVTLSGSTAVNVTLTIDTNVAAMRAMPSPFGPQSPSSPLSPILPALAFWWPGSMAGLAAFGRRRGLSKTQQRMLQLCLLVLMTGALAAGISGCGGYNSSNAAYVTPAGTSTMTVTATPTSGASQSVSITVTIT